MEGCVRLRRQIVNQVPSWHQFCMLEVKINNYLIFICHRLFHQMDGNFPIKQY